MIHLTLATKLRRPEIRFLRSCDQNGSQPLVLGVGCAWQGFGWRAWLIYEALKRLGNEPVLFTDASDVVLVRSIEEIEAAYRSIGSEILFSAETNCYPAEMLVPTYPESPTRYRFLNAGGWIGPANQVSILMEQIGLSENINPENDQKVWIQAYLDGRGITLDHHCQIFQSMWDAEGDLDQIDGVWTNRLTGFTPGVIHGNGGSNIDRVAAKYEYAK